MTRGFHTGDCPQSPPTSSNVETVARSAGEPGGRQREALIEREIEAWEEVAAEVDAALGLLPIEPEYGDDCGTVVSVKTGCGCAYELVEDGAVQRVRWFHEPDCLGAGAVPGADPGACPMCGQWRKAGMLHDCGNHLRALVANTPWAGDYDNDWCHFCGARPDYGPKPWTRHSPDCVWLAAHEWLAAFNTADPQGSAP